MKPARARPLWLRLLKALLAMVLVPVLLFEEWGWSYLSAALHRLARLSLWRWLEQRIASLPPWGALLAFAVPMVLLFPIKLLALYLFGIGQHSLGVVLLLGAKLAGTALLAWLFELTQPALMKMPWFARWYPRWKSWKDALLDQVRQSAPWRAARAMRLRTRRWWRASKLSSRP